jgi:hypothetical protein
MALLKELPIDKIETDNLCPKIMLVGTDGIGKTTAAFGLPYPSYFIVGDDFEIPATAPYIPETRKPKTFQELLDICDFFIANEVKYKSIILDNFEDVLKKADDKVIQEYNKNHNRSVETIAEIGKFGMGFELQSGLVEELKGKLQKINEKGIVILINGHTQIRMQTNPDGDDYVENTSLFREKIYRSLTAWANVSGFAFWETIVDKQNAQSKGKVISRQRKVRWETTNSSSGKNRYNLPEVMNFSLSEMLNIARKNMRDHFERISKIESLIMQLPEDQRESSRIKWNQLVGFEEIKTAYEKIEAYVKEQKKEEVKNGKA